MNAPFKPTNAATIERRSVELDLLEVRKASEEDRAVDVSVSSEEPYQRWTDLKEILDHGPSAVDLSRARHGLALLLHHDQTKVIGIAEGFRIVGRKLRAVLRFGRSAEADDVWKDVVAGVLRHVSVGYTIEETRPEGSEALRVTRWSPHEVSLVAIPADVTVGIGRSATFTKDKPMIPETKPEQGSELSERTRVSALIEIGRRFNRQDLAESAIREGTTVDQFRSVLIDALGAETVTTMNRGGGQPFYSGGRDEQKRIADFSIGKLIAAQLTGDWSQAGAEREVSQELSRKAGRPATGMWIPSSALAVRNTQTTASNTLVGVSHESGLFINSLTNKALVLEMGATRLSGLIESVSIPRQSGNASAAWYAEDASITESTPTFDAVTMAPKQVSGRIAYSKKLLVQGLPSIEQLMVNDLQRQIGLAIDVAAIHGTGASNQPTGIIATSGINTIALGTNGLAPTWAHIVQMETEVSVDNADMGSLGYLTNSKVRGKLKVTEKASTTGQFVWQDGLEGFGTVNGYKAGVSNQVSSTLTKGSSSGVCSAILFGNWDSLLVGEWGAIDLVIDPYSDGAKANVRIYAHAFVDIAVRQPASFCVILDALTT